MNVLDWILLSLSLFIIVITLLQGGKEGASSSIMGGMSARSFATLKERGPEKVMSRITFVTAGVFFFLAIIVRILSK